VSINVKGSGTLTTEFHLSMHLNCENDGAIVGMMVGVMVIVGATEGT